MQAQIPSDPAQFEQYITIRLSTGDNNTMSQKEELLKNMGGPAEEDEEEEEEKKGEVEINNKGSEIVGATADDGNDEWETVWTLTEDASAISTPRFQLPIPVFRARGASKEQGSVGLVLTRNSAYEIDLSVSQVGTYLLDLEMEPLAAPSLLSACGIDTNWVEVHVFLTQLQGSSEILGSMTKIRHPTNVLNTVDLKTLVLSAQFTLTRAGNHGTFEFTLKEVSVPHRLRMIMTSSRFASSNKSVSATLKLREARATELATHRRGSDVHVKIRKEGPNEGDSRTRRGSHTFFQAETFTSFVAYLSKRGLTANPIARFRRAGSETFHEQSELLANLSLEVSQSEGNSAIVPLCTRGSEFVEDLSTFKDMMTQKGNNNPEQTNENADDIGGKTKVVGRNVLLRGVNLAGNTKLPIGIVTELSQDFPALSDRDYCRDKITFVGRPFPLEEADEHLSRIVRWGFNCLRFLVTWEAIEHAGPGEHDIAYLDYIEKVIERAGYHGLYVFVDPHQDVWSRFTGGSGAPAWTLELCGLDVTKLQESQAAFTHYASSPQDPKSFRKMIWPQNYQRFASLHIFALFFAGKQFAPKFLVNSNWTPGTNPEVSADHPDAVNVQQFLQSRFLESMRQVALRVAKFPHVLGFDTFNEPSAGFIGKYLDRLPQTIIPPGRVFRPIDAMTSAAGIPTNVKVANGIGLLTGAEVVNNEKISAWLLDRTDTWQAHGVWSLSNKAPTGSGSGGVEVELLKPNYFAEKPDGSGPWNFFRDFLVPFAQDYQSMVKAIRPNFLIFLEGDAFGHNDFFWPADATDGVVNATHWYDGVTLFMRRYNPRFTIDHHTSWPVFGRDRVKQLHSNALAHIKGLPRDVSTNKSATMPTLIGEMGCPYDLNDSIGLKTGDFSSHIEAMNTYYSIFDKLMLNSTHWNYGTENSNVFGDHWNLENLSIFSREQQTDPTNPDSGGRAITGFCRPWAPIVAGSRLHCSFDVHTKVFIFRYFPSKSNFECGDPLTCTTLYIPDIQFESRGIGQNKPMIDIRVKSATYVCEKLPGRHMLYVWATKQSRLMVIEPVEIRVSAAT